MTDPSVFAMLALLDATMPIMFKRPAHYIHWEDDIYSCSECAHDISEFYPEACRCPNCGSGISRMGKD